MAFSFSFPPSPAVGFQGLAREVVGGDDKDAVRLLVPDVNHLQVAAGDTPAKGDPGVFPALKVIPRSQQHLANFLLGYIVIADVRLLTFRVDVEPDFHSTALATARARFRR